MAIGTPVEIGSNSNDVDSTSIAITVGPAGVPADATIIVDTVNEGINDTGHSCLDNKNGAYVTEIVPTESRTGVNGRRFRFSNSIALVDTDVITVSWTGLSNRNIARAYYITGLPTTTPLSGTPTGQENSNAFPNSGNLTTLDASAIILGFVSRRGEIADGYTEDSGFTTIGSPVVAGAGTGNNARVGHSAYRIVSATETINYDPTLGVSRVWAAGISAYKEAEVVTGITIQYETGFSGPATTTGHGDSITITGTGFGAKAVAAPVIWDDASGPTDIRNLWEDGWPEGCVNPDFNIQRRDAPFRNVSPPHNRVGRFIAGAHGEGANPFDATKGPNVICWKNFSGNSTVAPIPMYVSYWQRYDPNWQFAASNNNQKPAIYGVANPPTLGSRVWFSYMAHLPLDYSDFTKWQLASENNYTPSFIVNGHVEGINPYSNWIKIEIIALMAADSSGFIRIYENGLLMFARNNITDSNNVNNRRMGIGGFGRPYGNLDGKENYRYFTDCYIDNTHQRVMILDNDVFLGAGHAEIREMQIPTAWADTSITFTVNEGVHNSLNGRKLFVVDDTNTATLVATFSVTAEQIPPVITSQLTASAHVDEAFNYQIVATNNPTSFAMSGEPSGWSVNTSTGLITGITQQSGSFNIQITATNAFGSDIETLVANVANYSGVARRWTKNVSNYMSLGTGTIGSLLNGASQVTTVFQFRAITATLNSGDNLLVRIPNGSSASIYINFQNISGNVGSIRFAARSQDTDAWDQLLSSQNVEIDRWHTVVAHADFAAGSTSLWIDGVSHGSNAVTFGSITYSHEIPTSNDSVGGGAPPANTGNQFDGPISFLAFYNNLADPAALAAAIESGIHPFDAATASFFMSFGAETPDVDKVGEVITSQITGSLLSVVGPTTVVIPDPNPPIIVSPLTAVATVGQPFFYAIDSGTETESYDASPLPASLVINVGSGEITGTVDVANTYNITLTATNGFGSDIETLVLTASNQAPASGIYLPVPSKARGRSHEGRARGR